MFQRMLLNELKASTTSWIVSLQTKWQRKNTNKRNMYLMSSEKKKTQNAFSLHLACHFGKNVFSKRYSIKSASKEKENGTNKTKSISIRRNAQQQNQSHRHKNFTYVFISVVRISIIDQKMLIEFYRRTRHNWFLKINKNTVLKSHSE